MGMQKGWMKCDISDGLLPEEYAIVCDNIDGNTFSFFATQEIINEEKNMIRVDVMECRGDACLVYIPSQPLEGLSRTVKVPLNKLHGIE